MSLVSDHKATLVRVGFEHWVVPNSLLEVFLYERKGIIIGEAGSDLAKMCNRPMLHKEAKANRSPTGRRRKK